MSLQERLADLDWQAVEAGLDEDGWAVTEPLLTTEECDKLRAGWDEDGLYRKRIVMQRHGYGQGEYGYFAYPLPAAVAELRSVLYRRLAPIANRWEQAMGREGTYPPDHADFLARCHAVDQTRPTPLLLKYGPGDYNRLHQDLYGPCVFPIQTVLLLSRPGTDFTGGEFVLTEQRPRMHTRAEVVPLEQGRAVIFAVNQRPVQAARGAFRVQLRHGVSRVRSGERYTLGVIFHDAP